MSASPQSGPLEGISVVDATGPLGSYAGRLLADLGAGVLRLVAPDRAQVDGDTSAREIFMHAGKQVLEVDLGSVSGRETMEELLAGAQVLLTSDGPAALSAIDLHPSQVIGRHHRLVHTAISPFGLTGPWANRPACDLTLLACGGLLALAGDPDRAPVRAWGEQTVIIAGTYATVATLIAIQVLESEGRGQFVDLSVQEAVAHSLENAAQEFDLEGTVRRRNGASPREAGTGLFRCLDGWIYLVGGMGGRSLAWDAIVGWLVDGGVTEAATLAHERWQEGEWRRDPRACAEFRELFERFSSSRTKRELFASGQRLGISVAPVSTPADLIADEHLSARRFFQSVAVAGELVTMPGSPYRFLSCEVGYRPVGEVAL
jgi:benzylsuccinate CoA-transferase BbsE subunit